MKGYQYNARCFKITDAPAIQIDLTPADLLANIECFYYLIIDADGTFTYFYPVEIELTEGSYYIAFKSLTGSGNKLAFVASSLTEKFHVNAG